MASIVINGQQGTVVYLNDLWKPVAANKATLAKVIFDDGKIVFYKIADK